MVAGGGLAGMEAATILAQRGHQVTLYEKSEKLGGQWNILAAYRPEISALTRYLSNELMKSGAKVIFNAEVDLGLVKKTLPEVVVIATGAKQKYPEIPGVDCENVVLATDVLSGKAGVGKEVVVVGGRLVGLDVANYLAEKGHKVSVVTRREVARDVGYSLKQSLLDEAIRYGVYMYTHVAVESITERGVSVVLEGELVFLKADTVVIATGSASENTLYETLKGVVPELHLIGDGKEPRNSLTAIHEGFEIGHLVPAPPDSRLETIHRGE
jgi:NADPH-dependent 2,4-dienoyl-CoA reductase/sulfur reductase-like enzyme